MNVAVLQQFLRSLAEPMQAAGASQKVIQELDEAGQALEPFKELDFAQFAVFLHAAEEYHRTGVAPVPAGRSRAPKSLDPSRIHELAQQAAQLKERAAGADSPADAIGAEFDQLGMKALTKKDVLALAREVGARTTVRMTQDEAIAAVRRWVLGQEEAPAPASAEEPPEVQPVAQESASALSDMSERPA